MRLSRRFQVFLFLFLVFVWSGAALAYSRLPEVMATHWGLTGEPDGWMPRIWGVLWGPALLTFMALLYFYLIPAIEPWQKNLRAFWREYVQAGWGLLIFLSLMYAHTLAWNLGYTWDVRRVVGVGMALLFAILARLLVHARPNWFFGIRTPWTLSSPWVWREVHRRGARTLALVALLWLLGALWPAALLVAFAATMVWAAYLVAYSYWLYRSRMREGT